MDSDVEMTEVRVKVSLRVRVGALKVGMFFPHSSIIISKLLLQWILNRIQILLSQETTKAQLRIRVSSIIILSIVSVQIHLV